MVVDVHAVAVACTVQAVGSWVWYYRYPNHSYRGRFLLGGFLIGLVAAAWCMLLGHPVLCP